MDKKYIKGGTIVLPNEETMNAIEAIGTELKKQFGFKPSRADVVAYLVANYQKQQKPAEVDRKQ